MPCQRRRREESEVGPRYPLAVSGSGAQVLQSLTTRPAVCSASFRASRAMWVLDVDNSQDVDAIRADLGELAAHALTIAKSRRGAHVYFAKNSGEVRNRQWALERLSRRRSRRPWVLHCVWILTG